MLSHTRTIGRADQALLDEIKGGFESVGALHNGVKLKATLTGYAGSIAR
ncbi:MAG: hypothetical protein R2932_58495 [Caldilineaceae bacterium]